MVKYMLAVHAICWIGHNVGNALLPYDTPKIAGSPASTIHVKITIVSTAATPEMCIRKYLIEKGHDLKTRMTSLVQPRIITSCMIIYTY